MTWTIEEAPASLASVFRWWLNVPGREIDAQLQRELHGSRDVRFICGDYLFWLVKENDLTEAIRTMARWADLPGRRAR